mmetsp:Transcript_47835/g.137764  ORF Transcript_47835/g.137764 Transcript_47835/m.137764 type:complete len:201 (+) Transcript_47835:157-759(+)
MRHRHHRHPTRCACSRRSPHRCCWRCRGTRTVVQGRHLRRNRLLQRLRQRCCSCCCHCRLSPGAPLPDCNRLWVWRPPLRPTTRCRPRPRCAHGSLRPSPTLRSPKPRTSPPSPPGAARPGRTPPPSAAATACCDPTLRSHHAFRRHPSRRRQRRCPRRHRRHRRCWRMARPRRPCDEPAVRRFAAIGVDPRLRARLGEG